MQSRCEGLQWGVFQWFWLVGCICRRMDHLLSTEASGGDLFLACVNTFHVSCSKTDHVMLPGKSWSSNCSWISPCKRNTGGSHLIRMWIIQIPKLTQSPKEIACRSLMYQSVCWIQIHANQTIFTWNYFFELSGRHLCHKAGGIGNIFPAV